MAKHRPQSKRLTERVASPFAGSKVNREAGTIDGVLICGTTSANGRDYPANVLRRDCAKYEGRPVNCDHGQQSTVDRRFGWFTNVRPGDDGRPRGTLNCLRSHPMFERVMEAAERNPALFGFSHVALCRTRPGTGGREVVEEIQKVESIDLVAEPATTQGLFEHRGGASVLTIKQLAESIVKHPKSTVKQVLKVKALAEMDGMGDVPTAMDAPPAADGDADDAVMAAFKAAISDVVDKAMTGDLDPKDAIKKIKGLLSSHAGLNDDGTPDTDGDPATGGGSDGDDKTPESKSPTLKGVIAECKAAGLASPTTDDLEALVEIPTVAGRARLIAGLKKAAEAAPEKPNSTGRTRIDPVAAGAGGTKPVAESCPTDGKAFAESIK